MDLKFVTDNFPYVTGQQEHLLRCILNFELPDKVSLSANFYYLHSKRNFDMGNGFSANMPAAEISKRTGISSSYVLESQKILERKLSTFSIIRERDENRHWQSNVIQFDTTMLGDGFAIKINLSLFEAVLRDASITPLQKRIWLYFYIKAFKRFCLPDGDKEFTFTITADEFLEDFKVDRSSFNRALKVMASNGYILHKELKVMQSFTRRRSKRVHRITINIPDHIAAQLAHEPRRQSPDVQEANQQETKINEEDEGKTIISNNNITNNKNHIIKNIRQSLVVSSDKPSQETEPDLCLDEKHPKDISEQAKQALLEDFEEKFKKLFSMLQDESLAYQQTLRHFQGKEYLLKRLLKEKNKKSVTNTAVTETRVESVENPEQPSPTKKTPKIAPNKPLDVCVSEVLHQTNQASLGSYALKKAKNYARKLIQSGSVKGQRANALSATVLQRELVHFLARDWNPTKLNICSEQERVDSGLRRAWGLVSSGKWQPPHLMQKADILSREHQHYVEGFNNRCNLPDLSEHNARYQQCLNQVQQIAGRA